MIDWKTYKGQNPFTVPSQGTKLGYDNNPAWTPTATKAHAPCGHWHKGDFYVPVDVWLIDGVRYRGIVSTVAGGRYSSTYSNLDMAILANNALSVDSALYILGTGEHNFNVVTPNHRVYFRGVNTVSDAVITMTGGSSTLLLANNAINMAENVLIDASNGGQNYTVSVASNDALSPVIGIVNKCYIKNGAGAGALITVNANAVSALFSYCTFEKNSTYSALYVARSITSLLKCYQSGTWVDSYGTGSYVVDDVVSTPTVGYRVDYGDLRIVPTTVYDVVPRQDAEEVVWKL